MAERFRRPYFDATCWITALSGEGPHAADIAEWLLACDRGQLQILTSVLMPVEVLGGSSSTRTAESAALAEQALRRGSVVQVNVTRRIVTDARALRLDHGLQAMDAMHVASAAFGRADVLLTNDEKICRLESYDGMPIRRPLWQGDLPFSFDED